MRRRRGFAIVGVDVGMVGVVIVRTDVCTLIRAVPDFLALLSLLLSSISPYHYLFPVTDVSSNRSHQLVNFLDFLK